MQIKELSRRTGLQDKTIRYYEEIGVLPPPKRLPNGYRDYDESDVERVRFVMGMRRLDFSLDDISEILAMRDRRADEIAQRIVEMRRLEKELRALYALGLTFPTDDVEGKNCVCHLVREGPEM